MENTTNPGNQSRFLTAAILSLLVLVGWSYFFAPTPPAPANTNTAANTAPARTPVAQPTPAEVAAAPIQQAPDTVPARELTVRTPLYEVKLDSRGAVATSWILFKNRSSQGEKTLYADRSAGSEQPLQLISPEGLRATPRLAPFRIISGDAALEAAINERNYQFSEAADEIVLAPGEERPVTLTMTDPANGLEVTKSFVFRAENFVSDLGVRILRNGQPLQGAKLQVGPSIGDQGIAWYSLYHIEPEAVVFANGDSERWYGTSFTYNGGTAVQPVGGTAEWAGVGDTYFAMAAVPAHPAAGVELHASRYEHQTEPYFDGLIAWITRSRKTSQTRHLVSAYIPVAADGSVTHIYAGSKDFFTLREYNAVLTSAAGRPIDIDELINFGWFSFIAKPLAPPMLWALHYISLVVHNYGVAIIIFTFLFYSLLFPLRWSQSRSFKKAAGNAPKMKALQDQIKDLQKKGVPTDDPRMRALQMEQLKMTKDALPIGGCLPMLLQFPLLIALYVAVTISLDFRQASFLWLPDLSSGDPYHILEFAFAISMVLSMKFMPTAPAVSPEQQMQQKMMTYMMPVLMLWVMWSAPSGLLLYWFFGNLVSFAQQLVINRMNKTNDPPAAEVVDSVPKNAKKVKGKPKLSTS
jgi:YidC/Oxa1 family membrane protein insertase